MSTDTSDHRGPIRLGLPTTLRRRLARVRRSVDGLRGLSMLATLALVASFSSVMYAIADVAGTPDEFLAVLVGSLLAATLLARFLSKSTVVAIAAALLVVGLTWYLVSLSYVPRLGPILRSNLALLTGQSLNQIRESGIWVVGVAPAPVIVTWYFALRRHYGGAALVGGGMLGYLVMTGDATWPTTLIGVVAAGGVLGFGDLDRRGTTGAGVELVAIALAVMVIVPLGVSVVPAGGGGPIGVGGGDGGSTTIETALLEDSTGVQPGGAVDLSPEVRFAIESPVERYWKAAAYDRYTGEGWVRTGGSARLDQTDLPFPPGPRRTVRQTVEVESPLSTLPAAWRPVAVDGAVRNRVSVSDLGDLLVGGSLQPGETYAVTSAVMERQDRLVRTAGRDYPPEIRERYTYTPESTPDRIERRTDEITADADTPYETAVAIERYLETNKNYSLSVDRPGGDVADDFLFEMDAGYCTYFATTMAVMLRSQDVPARLATGYASGQQVEEDRWVVRGLDAHAWVEVYVEDVGWVTFDPTPAGPRRDAEVDRIESARQNNETAVDTNETRGRAPDDRSGEDPDADGEAATPTGNGSDAPGAIGPDLGVPIPEISGERPEDDTSGPGLPSREHVALGFIVLAGAAAGLRRAGAGRWLLRTATVAWQPRLGPETDVERAFRRVSIVLERRHRPRRSGETVRDYLDAIDAPAEARRVATIRERARYGDGVDADLADEAVGLADDLRSTGGAERPTRGPY